MRPECHPPVSAGPDHRLFQLSQVPPNVGSKLVEVQDGIGHQLPGSVVSDVSTAVDFMVLHTEGLKALRGGDTWFASPLLPKVKT